MHYCWTLYTNEKPSKEKIEEILNPYNVELNKNYIRLPILQWDYYLIGGRYCGLLKAKTPEADVDDGYFTDTISDFYKTLTYGKDEVVNQMMYVICQSSSSKNKYFDSLWTAYRYFGWQDGHMRCDGAPVKTIMNNLEDIGYGFITDDDDFSYIDEKSSDYRTKCLDIIEKYKNGYVTILDLHS